MADFISLSKIRLRRGTAAQFTSNNPTLLNGEPAYETDSGRLKVGDGSTDWINLPYFTGADGGPPVDNTYADVTAILADQGTQQLGFIYYVADASDDPRISSGGVYYHYLGSNFGDIVQDYTPMNIEGFNWNRAIRKLPQVGDVPTGTLLGDGIDEIFFGQIDTTSIITNITIVQDGETSSPTLTGDVTFNDGTVTAIRIVEQPSNNVVANPVVATSINEVLPAFEQKIETPITYIIEFDVDYPGLLGQKDQSASTSLTVVYPFLVGVNSAGLVQGTIYGALTRVVTEEGNQYVTAVGGPNRLYVAYPDTYADLLYLRDEDGNNLLGNLMPSSPAIMDVDSTGLTDDWTVSYKVYESNYDVELTTPRRFTLVFTEETI